MSFYKYFWVSSLSEVTSLIEIDVLGVYVPIPVWRRYIFGIHASSTKGDLLTISFLSAFYKIKSIEIPRELGDLLPCSVFKILNFFVLQTIRLGNNNGLFNMIWIKQRAF